MYSADVPINDSLSEQVFGHDAMASTPEMTDAMPDSVVDSGRIKIEVDESNTWRWAIDGELQRPLSTEEYERHVKPKLVEQVAARPLAGLTSRAEPIGEPQPQRGKGVISIEESKDGFRFEVPESADPALLQRAIMLVDSKILKDHPELAHRIAGGSYDPRSDTTNRRDSAVLPAATPKAVTFKKLLGQSVKPAGDADSSVAERAEGMVRQPQDESTRGRDKTRHDGRRLLKLKLDTYAALLVFGIVGYGGSSIVHNGVPGSVGEAAEDMAINWYQNLGDAAFCLKGLVKVYGLIKGMV